MFKCGIFLLVLVCGIGYCAGACYDSREDCNTLAKYGGCSSMPHAVLRKCPIACEVKCQPCKDKRLDCQQRRDHCRSFSTIHDCPLTCGACTA